jgi:hypothetical protein
LSTSLLAPTDTSSDLVVCTGNVLARVIGLATLSLGHRQICGDNPVISRRRKGDNEQLAIFLVDFIFGSFIGHFFILFFV